MPRIYKQTSSSSSSGGTPGGSNTELQYNNAGVFGGTTGVSYTLANGGSLNIQGGISIIDGGTGMYFFNSSNPLDNPAIFYTDYTTGQFIFQGIGDNFVFIKADQSTSALLNTTNLTANHTFALPNKDGTFAMLSDIVGTAWGSITGTLSNQTDLQTALNAKQPLDSDLTTIAGLTATTDNFLVSVANAWASRTPAQVKTTLALTVGTNVQAWDATLDAFAAYNTNGMLTQTAADTFTGRTITGTSNQVVVSNGNGVSGNPTLSLPQNIDTAAAVQFGTLQLPAGSATAPPLFFTGALTSGMFGAGTNQLGIAVGGTLAIQLNSQTSFGWHGTAPSTSNVNTTTLTNTATLNPSVFNSTTFTYGYTGIGSSSGVIVLSFEGINQRSSTAVTGASFTATQKTSLVNTASGISVNPKLDSTTAMSSGTLTLIGTDFAPSPAGGGLVTGGTVNIIGLRIPTLPANYAGGGATVNFYSVYSSGAAILYNNGQVGVGVLPPTANIHIAAGTSTANTAPLQMNSGTLETAARAGVMEYNGNLYFTQGGIVRYSIGGTLFDHYADAGNTTTGETDLYSDTTAANTLNTNGDKIIAEYGGITVASGTATRDIRAYFAGTSIFDSTAITTSTAEAWKLIIMIIRESSTVIRAVVTFVSTTSLGASVNTDVQYNRLTGLTLSGTNILKITGQAGGVGAATNDIVAKLGFVRFKPAI